MSILQWLEIELYYFINNVDEDEYPAKSHIAWLFEQEISRTPASFREVI